MKNFRNRYGEWAIVTGASSGIGAKFSEKLAEIGINLVIVARRVDLLEELKQSLTQLYGIEVVCLQADMANYSASKGYLLNFGEALHRECKGTGVDVLVVAPGATDTPGKDLHAVDYSKLPIIWMSADRVVEVALRNLGKRAFVIPGIRNRLTACLTSGLWSRGLVQGYMKKLAKLALP
jgi:short-subunit dehydrogenase